MSRAARSVLMVGACLVATGPLVAAIPNRLIVPLGFAETHEPWIRLIGVIVTVTGSFYVQAARLELVPVFRFTVWGRGMLLAGLALLAMAGLVPPMVVAFGVFDGAGALWTALALRADDRSSRRPDPPRRW